jgi:cytochrome P450
MFYYELVCERRANPQDDMISRLTQVDVARADGVAKLTDAEIAAFAMMLGGAGAETVVKLIGNAAVTFAANPEQWRKLHEDRSKIPGAFEELLRYEAPSQYQLRYSKRDVTLHETTIPSGSIVMLITGRRRATSAPLPTTIGSTSTGFRPGTTSISGTASIAALAPLSRGWRAGSRST